MPEGSRSRRRAGSGAFGFDTSMRIVLPVRCNENESGPKLVRTRFTSIVAPFASHARGVANARSRPRGAPRGPRRSCTSSSFNVSRKLLFAPRFGGMYIVR